MHYKIQNIVDQDTLLKSDIKLFTTKTYLSIFSICEWKRVTNINNFFLHIKSEREAIIEIHNASSKADTVIAMIKLEKNQEADFQLSKGQDLIYITSTSKFILRESYYYTTDIFNNNPNIAIVIPTYNRLEHIKKHYDDFLQLLNMSYFNNVDLYIINNGHKLPLESSDRINILDSKLNIGGAGGYYLGTKRVLACDRYTHCLYIDDDAHYSPETLFRTINLLKYLKKHFSSSIISGSMFSDINPTYAHCLKEYVDNKFLSKQYVGKIELTGNNLISTLYKLYTSSLPSDSIVYAAWWYACIPIKLFNDYGLPMRGYFFRGDDIEFGIRTKSNILALNGIYVNHPEFESKSSILRTYLGFRNYIITYKIHNLNKYLLIKFVAAKLFIDLKNNNIVNLEIRVKAIYDAIGFKNEYIDGDNLIASVSTYNITKNKTRLIFKMIKAIFYLFRGI